MFYAYILINQDGKRTYTGHTSDWEKRLIEHNRGEVVSSKNYRPYEILYFESFGNLKDAKARELFYKSSLGRYHLKKIVAQWKNSRERWQSG